MIAEHRQGRQAGEGRPEPTAEADAQAHAVIGAAIQVHRVLGPGLPESVYERALCIELTKQSIPFARRHRFSVVHDDIEVGGGRIDLLVDEPLIVEIKAVESLAPIHHQQLLACLRARRLRLGLLIHFNVQRLRDGVQRIINSP